MNKQEILSIVETINKEKVFSFDLETTGLDFVDDTVIGIGLATKDNDWYIDVAALEEADEISYLDILINLLPLFNTKSHLVIAHNTSFDLHFLRRDYEANDLGKEFNEYTRGNMANMWDTLQMATLWNENLIGVHMEIEGKRVGVRSLKALSRLILNREQTMYETDFEDWDDEAQEDYGKQDVRNCYDLAVEFNKRLKEAGLDDYYRRRVAPMTFVVLDMEYYGIKVDLDKVNKAKEAIDDEIAGWASTLQLIVPGTKDAKYDTKGVFSTGVLKEGLRPLVDALPNKEDYLTKKGDISLSQPVLSKLHTQLLDNSQPSMLDEIVSYTDVPFNPNSTVQLGEYLTSKKYPLPVTVTGKPSVSEDTINNLSKDYPDDPLWEPLLKYRSLNKLKGTYVDAILDVVWEDGRVHPQWNSCGTVTGRFSSSSDRKNSGRRNRMGPALQTIPRPDTIEDGGWAYNPREWFIADEGKCLCVWDLSQAEVRMLAVLSEDEALTESILTGEDIHQANSKAIWPDKWEETEKIEDEELRKHTQKILRAHAKSATFGTIYGIGSNSMADNLSIEKEDAIDILEQFYNTFSGVRRWKNKESRELDRNGTTKSLLGRLRSPILLSSPPPVIAKPDTKEFVDQTLQYNLWAKMWEHEIIKSHIDVDSHDVNELRSRAIRQGINFKVQGSVAEIINQAAVQHILYGYKLVAQVHDEMITELDDTEEARADYKNFVERLFNVSIRGVPFKVDVKFGYSWGVGKE